VTLQDIYKYVLSHKIVIFNICLILAVSGASVLLWFGGNNLIVADDFLFAPHSFQDFLRSFYTWSSFSLGGQNTRAPPAILGQTLKATMEIAGLSLVTSEKIWFFLFFALSGLSMYFLIATVVKDQRRHLAGLTGALFYMFNPYVAISITAFTFDWFFYASIPLLIGLYIKGVDERKGLKYAFLTCIIWSIVVTINYVRPSFIVFSWALLILYLVFHILVSRNKKKVALTSLRFTGILFALWICINLYWILPMINSFGYIVAQPVEAYASYGASLISGYVLTSAPLNQLMRLLGWWAFQLGYRGYPYYYWAPAYNTPIFVFVGFLIPVLAFSSLLFRNRNKHVFFFAIVTLLALLVASGAYFPFGGINTWLVTHIPFGLSIIPRPFQDITPYVVLGYAFLVGYVISTLYTHLGRRNFRFGKRKIHNFFSARAFRSGMIAILLFLIVGLYAFPVWTGQVMQPGNEYLASNRYQIPNYYYEAADWLSAQKDSFNIFQLPYSIAGYATYVWNNQSFSGMDPTPFLLNRPVISETSGDGIGMFLAESFVSNSTADTFAKMLALMNVKYVLLQRDANWIYLGGNPINYMSIGTSLNQLEALLNSTTGLTLEKSFGELDFYRDTYWEPLLVYTGTDNILVSGNATQLMQTLENDDVNYSECIASLSDQLSIGQLSAVPVNTIFLNSNDFLSLLMSELGDYVITIPEQASLSIHDGNVVVEANFSARSTQVCALWVEVPPSLQSGRVSASIDGSLIVTNFSLPVNDISQSSWANLGNSHLTGGNHVITLNITDIDSVPEEIALIPQQAFNSTYNALSSALLDGRVVYQLEPQQLVTARYYPGWKGVISTNGQGDPDMLIFPSPSDCPYINTFPPQSPAGWSAYNSTLVYITTSASALTINSILIDGIQTSAVAWWETGTTWSTYSVSIPPNQRAILQIGGNHNVVTLQTNIGTIAIPVYNGESDLPIVKSPPETSVFIPKAANYLLAIEVATGYGYGNFSIGIDNQTFSIDANSQEQGPVFTYKYIGPVNLTVGYHTISTSGENTIVPVYEGSANPINWTSTFTNQSCVARYYAGWQAVVTTDGTEAQDAMSFPSLDQCPYTFPSYSPSSWYAYNSTLVYLTTGNDPLRIDGILADGKTATDITGVWWETGWMGMGTNPVTYPIIIPPNQRVIIQIDHKADNVTLETSPPQINSMLLYSLESGESFISADNLLSPSQTNVASISYEEINPTQYTVHINASEPFYLVFSETYDNDWVASISGQQIPDQYHFTANGYANGWYVNRTGAYTITLEYWPQNLFYIGGAISATAFMLCMVYVSKDRLKGIYKKYTKSKQKPE
jgi:hypothetical protein